MRRARSTRSSTAANADRERCDLVLGSCAMKFPVGTRVCRAVGMQEGMPTRVSRSSIRMTEDVGRPRWFVPTQRYYCGAPSAGGRSTCLPDGVMCDRCSNAIIHYCGRRFCAAGECRCDPRSCDGVCGGGVTAIPNRNGLDYDSGNNGCNCPECWLKSCPPPAVAQANSKKSARFSAFANDPQIF